MNTIGAITRLHALKLQVFGHYFILYGDFNCTCKLENKDDKKLLIHSRQKKAAGLIYLLHWNYTRIFHKISRKQYGKQNCLFPLLETVYYLNSKFGYYYFSYFSLKGSEQKT